MIMIKIIGIAALLLCLTGCVRDNDAIYYPVGDVDIERGGLALEVGEGDVLVARSFNEEDYVLDTIAQYPNDPTLGKLTFMIDLKNQQKDLNVADFNGVKILINPMIGVIGTAPAGEDVIDGFVGSHGGNMDNKLITKGTRLYLPVRVPGALLQMGDVHAAMGDGELCGTGIEIPAEITVKVQLVKDFELNWPVLETHDKWYVNANAPKYDEALMNGSKEMQRLLMDVTGWDPVETYMYMSIQSDVEISQGCEPCEVQLSLRIGTPKLPQFAPLVPRP